MSKDFISESLKANNLTLGYHWIYDRDFLLKQSKKGPLLGVKPNKKHFDEAKISFYAYSSDKTYTVMGDILNWLFKEASKNNKFNQMDYKKLLLEQFMPGGFYFGYVESYAKKLVYNELAKNLHLEEIVLDDDQLIGFMPYLVFKQLKSNNPNLDHLKKADELASLLTNKKEYKDYFIMLDYIVDNLTITNLKDALNEAITYAPENIKERLNKAFIIGDSEIYIKHYSGTACGFHDAISLIYFILLHSNNYLEALELNILLGGASADRALLIGFIYSFIK